MRSKILTAAIAAIVVLFCAAVALASLETKYATSATGADPAVTFGPNPYGRTVVKAVYGSTDVALGGPSFYARSSATYSKWAPTVISTTNILITNTGGALTNGDTAVYVHANGVAEFITIAGSATTTNVLITSALTTTAVTNGDYIYEVTLQGKVPVGANGATPAGPGTNTAVSLTGDLFATPGDSPLYVVLDCATSAVITVTVDR